jgi:hypothetical protein
MNCHDLQNSWDNYRDDPAALTGAERAAIEGHLRRCPACAAVWARESAWLDSLAAEAADPLPAAGGFRASILNKWDAQMDRRRNPVLARIGWMFWPSLAAAAALALAVMIGPARPGGRPNMFATGGQRHRVHLGALVAAIGRSDLLHPARMLGGLKKQSSQLAANVTQEVTPDGGDLFDPAELFSPRGTAPPTTPRG